MRTLCLLSHQVACREQVMDGTWIVQHLWSATDPTAADSWGRGTLRSRKSVKVRLTPRHLGLGHRVLLSNCPPNTSWRALLHLLLLYSHASFACAVTEPVPFSSFVGGLPFTLLPSSCMDTHSGEAKWVHMLQIHSVLTHTLLHTFANMISVYVIQPWLGSVWVMDPTRNRAATMASSIICGLFSEAHGKLTWSWPNMLYRYS